MAKSDKKKFQRTSAPAKKKAAALKKAKKENKEAELRFRDQAFNRRKAADSKRTSKEVHDRARKTEDVDKALNKNKHIDSSMREHHSKYTSKVLPYQSRSSKAKKAKMLGKKKK